jgi:hypothetical protein
MRYLNKKFIFISILVIAFAAFLVINNGVEEVNAGDPEPPVCPWDFYSIYGFPSGSSWNEVKDIAMSEALAECNAELAPLNALNIPVILANKEATCEATGVCQYRLNTNKNTLKDTCTVRCDFYEHNWKWHCVANGGMLTISASCTPIPPPEN